MQFVRRGDKYGNGGKVQVYKYAGYDKEKKRSRLQFLGSMELDGKFGRKLERSFEGLDEKEKKEIKEKQRKLKQMAVLGDLPWEMLEASEALRKMGIEEMAALFGSKYFENGKTWQEDFAKYLAIVSKYIALNTNDNKIGAFFEQIGNNYDIVFRKTD